MDVILSRDTADISQPIELKTQLTFVSFGLQPGETVTFEAVLISSPLQANCACPPGQVVMPDVVQSFPLTCGGQPIELTDQKPYVVIDAPQGTLVRARWDAIPTNGQVVLCGETNTPNLTAEMRGCV